VVRLFESSLAGKLAPALFGADVALNPSQAAAAAFAAHAIAPDVVQALVLDGRLLMLRWFRPDRADTQARTVDDLIQLGERVLLRRRSGSERLEVARPNEAVQSGDRFVVLEEYLPETGELVPSRVEFVR
jgi:Trk K+ transport system NAD-binding subunit